MLQTIPQSPIFTVSLYFTRFSIEMEEASVQILQSSEWRYGVSFLREKEPVSVKIIAL